MFTCDKCGSRFSPGAVAVIGLPHPNVCPTCRRDDVPTPRLSARTRHLLIACIWSAVALVWLAIMLYGEWKRTDPWLRDVAPPIQVPPEPEELPRIPGTTATAMSIDF